ncbi:MAG: hypothetical protein COA89_10650, partial [Acidithiobacillus sp.]
NLVDWAKKIKQLNLKAAILDGELFDGADGVKRLSKFPTSELRLRMGLLNRVRRTVRKHNSLPSRTFNMALNKFSTMVIIKHVE